MSRGRSAAMLRSVVDQAVVARVREGRLRDHDWPDGLRAVVVVAVTLFALAGLLALAAGPIRGWSQLTVPNSLLSSVPDDVVWLLVFLLAFCLALLTTAAIHGPWWLRLLGVLTLGLLLGVWSVATSPTRGVTLAVLPPVAAVVVVVVLVVVRRRRDLAWWEFPVVLGLIGVVLALCMLDFARTERLLGFHLAPTYLEQTMGLLIFLVLPAAFAAGAAVAEVAVGLVMVATLTAQRQAASRWPYVVLAVVMVLRLAQEWRRLSAFDPVSSGWLAVLPALGLVGAFAVLGLLVARLGPLGCVPVSTLSDDLGRIAVPVGAAVIAMMVPGYLFLFGFQIVAGLAPVGFDPGPLVDSLVDGYRVLLGAALVVLGLWQARRGLTGLALVLGGAGVVLMALGVRLLTGYRWAFWLDPDALISVVTVLIVLAVCWLLVRRALSADRALGLAAVLALAVLLSLRSVISDPLGALLGYAGVAFVLFGVVWDFLTSSGWANSDGRRVRRPVRVLLAVGYPLLTVTVLAADALIRRPRTFSDLNGFAELGELVLGTALLGAAAVVVLSAVRGNRAVA